MKSLFARLASFCIGLSLVAAAPVVAAELAPDALVKRVTEEVLTIVRADRELQNGNTRKAIELVDTKVLPHFDFMRMTRLAVGRDWKKATPEQQKQLADEFRKLLVHTYANSVTAYRDQKIVYKPFKAADSDSDVIVRTEVVQPGSKPIELDYALEKGADGWKVFDVIVGGISLVTNYRETFRQEVSASGVDGLIKMLVDKNRKLEADTGKPAAKK